MNNHALCGTFALALVAAATTGVGAQQHNSRLSVSWLHFPASSETLRGALFAPPGKGPFPAVIALHGCGGLAFRKGGREEDWSARLTNAGFAVLFVDSFGSRGLGSQCRVRKRTVRAARERIDDAHAGLRYLQSRADIRPGSISLLGWSNGGATVVNAITTARKPPDLAQDFAAAVAFYPGCRLAVRRKVWDARVRLLILTGLADDWTPPAACIELARKAKAAGQNVNIATYPSAYHNFDHPDMPLRVRKNRAYSADGSGVVHQGTNQAARDDAIARTLLFLAR